MPNQLPKWSAQHDLPDIGRAGRDISMVPSATRAMVTCLRFFTWKGTRSGVQWGWWWHGWEKPWVQSRVSVWQHCYQAAILITLKLWNEQHICITEVPKLEQAACFQDLNALGVFSHPQKSGLPGPSAQESQAPHFSSITAQVAWGRRLGWGTGINSLLSFLLWGELSFNSDTMGASQRRPTGMVRHLGVSFLTSQEI